MPIKQRIAAHRPDAAKADSHIRFALRHAIAAQKQVIATAEEFGEREAQLVGEYERLSFYERLARQDGLLRVES